MCIPPVRALWARCMDVIPSTLSHSPLRSDGETQSRQRHSLEDTRLLPGQMRKTAPAQTRSLCSFAQEQIGTKSRRRKFSAWHVWKNQSWVVCFTALPNSSISAWRRKRISVALCITSSPPTVSALIFNCCLILEGCISASPLPCSSTSKHATPLLPPPPPPQ